MGTESNQHIGILDFGGQYAHLIARRTRELGVFSRIYQPDEFAGEEPGLLGVILSGSPESVGTDSLGLVHLEKLNVPVLGLCFGHQLMAMQLGGKTARGGTGEYGACGVEVDLDCPLFQGLQEDQTVWMSHRDEVTRLPAGFRPIASSSELVIAGFQSSDNRYFGLQFHPEVSHTQNGIKMLDNFLSICTDDRNWKADDQVGSLVAMVRKQATGRKLLLLLSGGVDSLVALALCIEAVGNDRILSVHVDTGFMRKDESKEIAEHLKGLGYSGLEVVDASTTFFEALAGKTEPEEKRKIIGKLFVDVVNEYVNLDSPEWMLVQGTIYPDTIESGSTKKADTIKTHHNRVEEIERLIEMGRVVEPLADLYKDEVRVLGRQLNLPNHLLDRHPFPGPGLAIRILASNGIPDADFAQEKDRLSDLLASTSLAGDILPVKSVGVQGDSRTYQHPAVLWDVGNSTRSWTTLKDVASLAVNRLGTINRLVYSVLPVNPDSLKLKESYADRASADLLREVDALVRKRCRDDEIWQLGVVSLPLFDEYGGQVFVMCPVSSIDAMTADVFGMDFGELEQLALEVQSIPGAGLLFYDISRKPPATIEWE